MGVYGGEPNWYGIDVDENNIFGTPGLDERFKNTLGILEPSREQCLYAIDGPHRLAGIKEALKRLELGGAKKAWDILANEDFGIVLVAADIHEGHLRRIRRMFLR